MIASRLASLVLLLTAIAAGGAFLLQRQNAAVLREQITLLHAEQRELATLRRRNQKLKSEQPSEAELASLRADRAAAMRLQTELNELRRRISAAETAAGASDR